MTGTARRMPCAAACPAAGAFVGILVAVVPAATGAEARQAGRSPVKVFILAGQSNMEGQGLVKPSPNHVKKNGGKGTLEYLVKDAAKGATFKHLVDEAGEWRVRDDVWIWYLGRTGGLTVGFSPKQNAIGPELQFGHVMGDYLDNQVLLIKCAWGGKSLAVDFRPPGAGGQVGPYYTKMLEHVREVLGDIKKHFPDYDGRGYEISGLGWHQGWNDRVNQAHNDAYEANMACFIRDVRKALGVEDLPFVIAETGMSGHAEKHPRALSLMKAQAVVAEREEFKGTVAFVGTKDYYRPPEESPSGQSYHWNSNAETYFLIGDGMGKAMKGLLEARAKAARAADEKRALLRGGAGALAPAEGYGPGCAAAATANGGPVAALFIVIAAFVCASLRVRLGGEREGRAMRTYAALVMVAAIAIFAGCRVARSPREAGEAAAPAPAADSAAAEPAAVGPALDKPVPDEPAASEPVDAPADDRAVKAKGVVKRIALEGGFWGIVADDGAKYDPRNLLDEFRKDGLRVRFEGRVVDAVTFHMWGKVLEITRIEKD